MLSAYSTWPTANPHDQKEIGIGISHAMQYAKLTPCLLAIKQSTTKSDTQEYSLDISEILYYQDSNKRHGLSDVFVLQDH